MSTDHKLVVVGGETASGKSALAHELARYFDGEIINADSWQIYRGFDIGTAKPSPTEQAEIPHHLLDITEASDDFTAAVYKDLANRAIADISGRGKLPIMVGGTGLYIDGVLFDFSFLPPGDPKVRHKLNKLTTPQLLALVEQQGIDTTGIDTRNKRRLIRLLETGGRRPRQSQLRPNTLIIGLKPSRKDLRANIEQRVAVMFKRGLKHEVKRLSEKYGWEAEAMKGIGYREWQPYFVGTISAGEVKRKIVKSTLELAKRQRTWFKRHPQIVWLEDPRDAEKLVRDFLK